MKRRGVVVIVALVVALGVGFLTWARMTTDALEQESALREPGPDAERDPAAEKEANERLLRAMKKSVDDTPDPVEPDPSELPSIEEVLEDDGGS